ncbi:hypothetical protein [Rhodococcus pyridinivorans]|uniref:hypothetical protein n=1 Tax=Rhodococcus pyridinivorans TaxID=103816 RepID=UPI0013A6ACE0|nr:hypothetical protein [Rhodococcus pyridinivorans]
MSDTQVRAKDLKPGDEIRIDGYLNDGQVAYFKVLEVDFTTSPGSVVLHVESNRLDDNGLTSPPEWEYTVTNRP